MAIVSDVATAISLIGKVINAAADAQIMKKDFKELADYLELVERQLEMLDDRELGAASVQTFRKIVEVLLQCHDLANSCQQRNTIYLMVNGKRIQNQLRGAQEKITKYLMLIPLIHFTQVFRRFKEEDIEINETWHEHAASFQEEETEINETWHEHAASFQEEDTEINETWYGHASDESDILGLVEERIANFTDNGFQSDAHLFSYEEIEKMTQNFETVIGRGGFGTVYYGFLEDGTDVAIKLQTHSSQQSDMEFFTELRNLTRVHHANLISLIGYCKDESYLAIAYEYMPGGSLDAYLRGKAGFPVLTWAQRLQIAYQAAQGLDYLHTECNPPIIHRDVKSSNILLGSDLEAKIADFGISKACNENDIDETTIVLGTPGYLDPEYCQTGHVSKASDVYSFGIILLEMITGQPPLISEVSIVEWISLRVANDRDFVDGSMDEYYDTSSMWKVLELARRCTDSSRSMRPPMAEVAIQLKGVIEMQPLEQITEYNDSEDMENEEVEEAFVTSIAQADRPLCTHQLSAILFTSWTHDAPGRRFWRCKNWEVDDCGYFKWHDPVQQGVMIEPMDFVNNQRYELDEEIKMMDEESAIHFSKWKALEEKIAECRRSKEALEMKSESMDRVYRCR